MKGGLVEKEQAQRRSSGCMLALLGGKVMLVDPGLASFLDSRKLRYCLMGGVARTFLDRIQFLG